MFENVVTNNDLSKIMDTSNEWIVERTGIEERRHIKKETETTATMGAKAAKIAIECADINKNDIDLILCYIELRLLFSRFWGDCSAAPDIPTCPAMDIRNQCSGLFIVYCRSVYQNRDTKTY